MPARLVRDVCQGLVHRPGALVGADRGQGIEHIGDRHHACGQRNGRAAQAQRVTAAVPLLVVGQGDGACQLQDAVLVRTDDLGANRRVLAHDLPFAVVQRPGLEQHRIGHTDLAHVVHGGRVQQLVGPFRAAADGQGQGLGKVAHAQHVHAGLVVLVLGRAAQALHDLQPRLAQRLGTHQGQVGADACAHHGRAHGFDDVVHATGFEALGLVAHVGQGRDEDHRDAAGLGPGLELAANVVAVELRHHDVQQDQVRGLLPCQLQRPGAVGGKLQAVVIAQDLPQHVQVGGLIVDQQQAGPAVVMAGG